MGRFSEHIYNAIEVPTSRTDQFCSFLEFAHLMFASSGIPFFGIIPALLLFVISFIFWIIIIVLFPFRAIASCMFDCGSGSPHRSFIQFFVGLPLIMVYSLLNVSTLGFTALVGELYPYYCQQKATNGV